LESGDKNTHFLSIFRGKLGLVQENLTIEK
jgi:hypothetical protein